MFKKKERKSSARPRDASAKDIDAEETTQLSDVLAETRELQRHRERNQGVHAAVLASGEKVIKDASADTGWSLARGGLKPSDGAEEESLQVAKDLGTAFTNTTDIDLEDAEMQRFVEERLRAKAGAEPVRDTRSDYEKDEQALYTVPAEMRRLQTQTADFKAKEGTRGMLSSAVLSGIPEVNLGMKAKFENIEKTEHARVTFIEKTREKAKNRAMAKRTADGEPKPTKIVVSREDSGLNFGRARFMGGNRGAGSNAGSSEGVVDVGSELTDHGKVFEMAKKKAFEEGVVESATYATKEVATGVSGDRGRGRGSGKPYWKDQASDDTAFDKFRKQSRRY